MYGSAHSKTYQSTQVSTVSKPKLILLLYDGAIRFTSEAVTCMEKGDIAGRGVFIGKAQRIIDELSGALDMTKGGRVAKGLSDSYGEMTRLYTRANISGDKKALAEALRMLDKIREAWLDIIGKQGEKDAKSKVAPPSQGLTISC